MAGLFVLRPECVVDVGWWDGAWLCPALSKGPTGRVSCLGKASILLVLTVKQPLDLFSTIKCHFLVEQFPEWLHSCEPLCEM